MKKALLFVAIAFSAIIMQAQKVDKAKDLLTKNKIAEAKTEIDNVLAIEKNKTNSDAWYTKAKVYLAISADPALKSTVTDARGEAFEAIKKYYEIESNIKDSTKRYLQIMLENNTPLVEMYKGYSADGATYYNANNFNDALTNFAKCIEVFDFMAAKKMIIFNFDTTTVFGYFRREGKQNR
jgi:tetratricopeptide (TPR) repeat protein